MSKGRRILESGEESKSKTRGTTESGEEPIQSVQARGKKERKKESRSKSSARLGPPGIERGSVDKVSNISRSSNSDSPMAIANSTGPEDNGAPAERPGILNRQQIEALRRWRRAGIEPHVIAHEFGLSLSTVYKHTAGVMPDPGFEHPPQPSPPVITPATGNGGELQQPSQASLPEQYREQRVPKLENEIIGQSRPQILERLEPDGVPNSSYTTPLNLSGQSWESIHLLLGGAAMQAGFDNVLEYFRDVILVDLKTVDVLKSAVPHSDTESLRKNLLATVRKANLYDKMLGEAEREISRKKPTGETES